MKNLHNNPSPGNSRNILPMALLLLALLFASLPARSQGIRPVYTGNNFVVVPTGSTPDAIAELAAEVTPSANQLAWQRTEFNAFIHFGMNTFTDREWGEGTENPKLFNPSKLNTRQWAKVIRDAGMKTVIITAKHHDGFCLWPSKFTKHSVAASPWKKGKGDVVGEVSAACREYGLKFGFYLSPWDKHEPSYGDSAKYNRYFMDQLRELLTNYGEVSEVWFDGACGEGPNGKKQVYDWKSWYALIRELQPGAVIAIMGPDVRWVGTESGYGRETEWSVIPDLTGNTDPGPLMQQQHPLDNGFIPRDRMDPDLGSREKLMNARSLAWYPAETDVSIRPGWFYHKTDNSAVKSPEKLVDIYFHSVGLNSVLLLNIPPDKRGLIHEKDVASLKGMKAILDHTFRTNLLEGAASTLNHDTITYTLKQPARFNVLMLREDIKSGQRIEQLVAEAWDGKQWKRFATVTTVGNKRIVRFPEVRTTRIQLIIAASRGIPSLMDAGLYFDGTSGTDTRK